MTTTRSTCGQTSPPFPQYMRLGSFSLASILLHLLLLRRTTCTTSEFSNTRHRNPQQQRKGRGPCLADSDY
ncbi:uncharacterized protein B0I36DRAFT_319318 [Microdochium trichocladiopsis]|uniref:Uncharacterized protein n=1 Tax=Microdochium trichocladiopsis TaxID=1682393 RepID=A0A9P9BXA9_9PEZI|nr:uncharacterized protein B0I36DRAFT_319318 [Microdochium trichocladiopsis]KAH7035896.1 hypothetical protein B0I36DRAFT_319318 [Microdochium trichocladiopsis]